MARAIPLNTGVTQNRRALVVGVSHDTPAFAAHAIAHWWHQEGSTRYSVPANCSFWPIPAAATVPLLCLENRTPVSTGQLLSPGRNRGSLSHRRFQMESHPASPLLRSLTQLGRRTVGFLTEDPPLCAHHPNPNWTSGHGLSRPPTVSLRSQAHTGSNCFSLIAAPRNSARVELHHQTQL
jgi:hypothetical protein